MLVECQICGKEFKTVQSQIKQGKGKLCSRKCSALWKSKIQSNENHPNWKGGLIDKKCSTCGKIFKVKPCRLKSAKYCSFTCHAKNRKMEDNPNWHGGISATRCSWCDKDFVPGYEAASRTSKNRFCNKECHNNWKSINLVGCNAANWRGGITPITFRIRHSFEYQKWRQDIFVRDGFVCKKCGDKRGHNLRAHHLVSFSKLFNQALSYMPLLSEYTAAMLYEPMWDIDNGITLCEKCHTVAHTGRRTEYGG